MTEKLVQTPTGRIVLHLVNVCNLLVHGKNPHLSFFGSALVRYVRGIG